jgi:hypothetical protein
MGIWDFIKDTATGGLFNTKPAKRLMNKVTGGAQGAGGGMGGQWSGTDPKLKKFQTLSHSQRKVQERLLQNRLPNLPSARNNPNFQSGSRYLQNLLSQSPQERYSQLEAPYMRQFQNEIMPGIAEQYAGAGAMGSSGFQNAAAEAGSSLMERLAALNLNQQNIFRGQQLSAVPMSQSYSQQPYNEQMGRRQLQFQRNQLGMQTPAFGYQNIPGQPGMGQGIAQGYGSMAGMGMAGGAGGFNPFAGFGDTSQGGIGGMGAGQTAGQIGGGLVGSAFGGPLGGIVGSGVGKVIGGWF